MTGGNIGSSHSGSKLTYDDFVLIPDDGKRHELIDGEHFVTPPPNLRHQAIVMNLGNLIWNYLQQHPIGRVFGVSVDVVLSKFDVVVPDVLYFSNERASTVMTPANLQGAPNLAVEVGSKSTQKRDRTIKRQLYERFGVDEYWFVDPVVDSVTVYRRTGERYERTAVLSRESGDVLTTPLLPGLSLPLGTIFKV